MREHTWMKHVIAGVVLVAGLIGVVVPSRADQPRCVFATADNPATVDAFEGMSEIPLTPQILRAIPHWAESYPIVFDGEGRLWLRGNVDDSTVFVLPKAWKALRIKLPNQPAPQPEPRKEQPVNYGVNLGQTQQPTGQIVTNDPALGQVLTGQATEQCPAPAPGPGPVLPDSTSSLAGLALPGAILIAVGAILIGIRKRAN